MFGRRYRRQVLKTGAATARALAAEARMAKAEEDAQEASERARQAQERADRLGRELAEIKGSLSQVAVYEGMDGSPTALLVSELARDHEELEARIDSVLHYLSIQQAASLRGERLDGALMGAEIARLLRGGNRVPDSPQGLGL